MRWIIINLISLPFLPFQNHPLVQIPTFTYYFLPKKKPQQSSGQKSWVSAERNSWGSGQKSWYQQSASAATANSGQIHQLSQSTLPGGVTATSGTTALTASAEKAYREYVPPLPSAPPAKRKLIQSQQDVVEEVTTLMIRHLPCKLNFNELEVGEVLNGNGKNRIGRNNTSHHTIVGKFHIFNLMV